MSLSGKAIMVTGASSGLGAHMTRFLAAQGARVAVAARRREALDEIAADIGEAVLPVTLDVGDDESVQAAVETVLRAFDRIDGLVNNDGMVWSGPAMEMPMADWERVIDVNLSGVFRVAQAVASRMADAGGGAIVNTASILGFGTSSRVTAYATSKAGVVHLTRSLALEWARHGIRVNAIAPGYFPSEMTQAYLASEAGQEMMKTIPMRRFGRPEDLDGPLELLLSDAGAYITGVTIPVDGGHLVRSL